MRISDWSSDVCSSDLEGQEFTRGTPNSWAPMSADEKLGLVYVPTGNATPDYYGGHRTANDDRFSSSVVALNAESGDVRWSFQTTHHDLWDYDVPAQPTLVDLPGGVQGLLQPTKRGEIFFRSEEHTSELQSLMRTSYAVFCLKKKT